MKPASSSAIADPAPQTRRRLTWNTVAAIVLIVITAGVILNLRHPLLLAPPNLEFTLPIYAALGLLWLPVFLICLLLGPTGKIMIPITLLLIGLVSFCIGLFFIEPAVPMGAFGLPLQCDVISQTPERIRYQCTADRMFLTETYILEGPTGWPVVWLVASEQISS